MIINGKKKFFDIHIGDVLDVDIDGNSTLLTLILYNESRNTFSGVYFFLGKLKTIDFKSEDVNHVYTPLELLDLKKEETTNLFYNKEVISDLIERYSRGYIFTQLAKDQISMNTMIDDGK